MADLESKERSKKRRTAPQWRDAAAGALSGALARTALAPVERVKLLSTCLMFVVSLGPSWLT
jgi:hypothetical protein